MTTTIQVIIASAALVTALGILHRAGRGVYRAARRIEDTFILVNHELRPNGSSSLRDAIDRIEGKADIAVTRAEEAATHALYASQNAAHALDRIERLDHKGATAIVVAPMSPTSET